MVAIPSTIVNTLSSPNMNRVKNKMNDQKLDQPRSTSAVGYETKASPNDPLLSATGESVAANYPTTANTAKPAMKLYVLLISGTSMESNTTGLYFLF